MDSALALSTPDAISANLRMILRGLLMALGAWRVESARAMVLYGRIGAAFGRVERMLVRFRAGKLPGSSQRRAVSGRRVQRKATVVMPRRFGWLAQRGGHQAVCFGLQLQTVLHTPEMAVFLEMSPQAKRALRPLCRALAVELPWTVDKPRAERTPLVRTSHPKPEPDRMRWPRGVTTWIRREKAAAAAIQRKHELVLKLGAERQR